MAKSIAEQQDKVLIFTHSVEIMDYLRKHLADCFCCDGLMLHGGTPQHNRQYLVDQFQREDGPPFFILSIRAGGTGLNLTAANHVIHFDRWWNPASENQASDRAFRIGQKRNVLVHKFISRGTLEEKIDKLIEEKQELADELLKNGPETLLTSMSNDELLEFIQLDLNTSSLVDDE